MGRGGDTSAKARAAGKQVGRPKKFRPEAPASVADATWASRMIDALNRPEASTDSYELQQFRKIDSSGVHESADLRKWLYDKRDGKAPQTVLSFQPKIDAARRERIRDLLTRLVGSAR